MGEVIFILGKNPELSIAEILAYLNSRKINFSVTTTEKEFLIVDFQDPSRYVEIKIEDLGGTIKIAVGYNKNTLNASDFFDLSRNSITFGLSFYNSKDWKKDSDYIATHFKNGLREMGIKSGHFRCPEDRSYLTHVEVIKKNFIENGEIVFCFSKGKYYVGKTAQVHNPYEFQKRDVKRPDQRPIFSIPPRLSKIMINLTGIKEGVILDPFCGIGTILQEAALQGFDIRGVDLDKSCIFSTIKNLGWLKKEYSLELKELDKKIINKDSKNLSKYFEKESIDGIVTEPYLGPPLKAHTEREQAEKIINQLTDLYTKVLSECHKVLKADRRVCIISPRIKVGEKNLSLNIPEICMKTGFKQVNILSKYKIKSGFPLTDGEERHRLIREINVLEKG